jgi:glycogen synthase
MKVLFLTKETPSTYFESLGRFLAEKGIEVHVVCPSHELHIEGAHVHPVRVNLHANDGFEWCMLLNVELVRCATELAKNCAFDLVHGEEWSTIPASIACSKLLEKPLVMTFHSVEVERGARWPHSNLIHRLEMDGAREANAIILTHAKTSEVLKNEIPKEKIEVIPMEGDWQLKVLEIYGRLV